MTIVAKHLSRFSYLNACIFSPLNCLRYDKSSSVLYDSLISTNKLVRMFFIYLSSGRIVTSERS